MTRRHAVAVAAIVFAISRLYLLVALRPRESDIYIYEQYAREHVQARARGVGVYTFHAETVGGVIEYPPLALQWIALPSRIAGPDAYARTYRALTATVDVVGFALLLVLVPRLFPRETPRRHLERWLLYVATGHVLGHLLYDRLDLVVGVLVLGALALLTSARPAAAAALAVLVLAVHYKLAPLFLAPVFLLATRSVEALRGRALAVARSLAVPCLAFSLLLVAVFPPLAAPDGRAGLEFLRYHGARGLHVESVPASLVLALSAFGHRVTLWDEFGAWSIRSSLTPALVTLSPALVAGLAVGVAALLLAAIRRSGVAGNIPWGTANPAAAAGFVIAALAAILAGSKVFSPQYLLWLLPVAPLMPTARRPRLWLFAAIALVTTAMFPYGYDQIVHGPTVLGAGLLIARNAAVVALVAAALAAAWRSALAAS